MDRKNKILLLLLILLVILQAGLICYVCLNNNDVFYNKTYSKKIKESLEKENLPIHYSYFSKEDYYNEAYRGAEEQIKTANQRVYGGILPHHLIVKDKIAAFLEGIKSNNYETIVLIGPDHFLQAKSGIAISSGRWETPFGYIEPDLNLIEKITGLDFVETQENLFIEEHSISGIVGFIKKSFPGSKIVPMVVNDRLSEAETIKISQKIYEETNKEKILVLASVDFSHYQPTLVADFHDMKSRAVIENFDFNEIDNLEIDSQKSIYILLEYLRLIGSQQSELVYSTNSGRLADQKDESTTSHNFYYFYNGKPNTKEDVNFLFFGDMMLDRHVGEKINVNGLDYLFEKIAGEEDRFFQGIDLVSANLEGAVTNEGRHYSPIMSYDFAFAPDLINQLKSYNFNFFNISNNHLLDQGEQGVVETRENLEKLGFNYSGCRDGKIDECTFKIVNIRDKKIGMVGLSMVYSKLDQEKIKELIEDLKKETDMVIINIHWGIEYEHHFNSAQQDLAHAMIDSGADIIIGHHPHVVQGLEIYNNKPILYSLGNFIFDQYFSPDTQEGLAVGIDISENKQTYFLFPFKSRLSQAELMKNKEKDDFYKNFISWSSLDSNAEGHISEGFLEL